MNTVTRAKREGSKEQRVNKEKYIFCSDGYCRFSPIVAYFRNEKRVYGHYKKRYFRPYKKDYSDTHI